MLKRSPVTCIGGYIGLAVVVLLFAPHIPLVTNLTGLSWPALPFTKLVHAFTVLGSRWHNGRISAHKEVPA